MHKHNARFIFCKYTETYLLQQLNTVTKTFTTGPELTALELKRHEVENHKLIVQIYNKCYINLSSLA